MGALGFGCKGKHMKDEGQDGSCLFTCLFVFCRFRRRTCCLYIKLGCTFLGVLSICLLGIYLPVDMKHCHIKPIVP